MLTFRSIRGRKHGDPKAANRLGEILVALNSVSFCSLTTESKEQKRRVVNVGQRRSKLKDSPISLQNLMIEYHSYTSKVKYSSHHQTIQDIIPAVRP